MSETTDFLFDIRKELDRHKAGGYQFSKKLTLTRQNPSATIMSTEDISATAKYIIENVMIDVHGGTAWAGAFTKLSIGDGVTEIVNIAKASLTANARYMLSFTQFIKSADFYRATPLTKLVVATDAGVTAGSDLEIYISGRITP
jgi:hypothetical protein